MRFTTYISVFFSLFFICCTGNQYNKPDCEVEQLDIGQSLKDIIEAGADTILFDLNSIASIDSLYVYQPYTSIKKLELKFGCRFSNFNYRDDDTWCLLVIKNKEGKYFTL